MIKTKSNKKMAISVVTQLLFIRFFCPAIASPEVNDFFKKNLHFILFYFSIIID